MMIRKILPTDYDQIRDIHARYYNQEFSITEFQTGYWIGSYVIVDVDDKIIVAAGVRPIAEVVMVTDKAYSPRDRWEALLLAFEALLKICHETHFSELHAFTHDEKWEHLMKRFGFKDSRGKALYLGINDGQR